jgi:Flp pilus assembly pilin Flp
MTKIQRALNQLLKRNEGVTTVEYAVMLGLIITAAVGAILSAGTVQKALWFDTSDQVELITPSGPKL